jgi:hypothetical protein
MAKKAPASPLKKAPAKRKPRPKKPPVIKTETGIELSEFSPETLIRLQEILDAKLNPEKIKLHDPTDYGEPVQSKILSAIAYALPCLIAMVLGIGIGVYAAGGIHIGPDNKPVPNPTPEPVKSFRVIFVKESGQTLSGEQVAIPGAKEIRDLLNAKTTAEGNQPGWREYDPQQITDNEQPTMKALWSAVKPQLLPAPCLVVEVNGKVTVMPFPATVAEAVETLKKHGGA